MSGGVSHPIWKAKDHSVSFHQNGGKLFFDLAVVMNDVLATTLLDLLTERLAVEFIFEE